MRSVPRRGLSLVEVVAGVALLATLLVGIVLAAGRHGAQLRAAEQRLAAVRAADRLLAQWYGEPAGPPRDATGPVTGAPGLVWRTRPLVQPDAEQLGLEIVRLEIRERGVAQSAEHGMLVTTEIALPGQQLAKE